MLSLHPTSSEAARNGSTSTAMQAVAANSKHAQHTLLIEDLPFCADAQQREKLTTLLGKCTANMEIGFAFGCIASGCITDISLGSRLESNQ